MMIFIALIGVLVTYLCLQMAISPDRFSAGIISFSQWRFFHPFEILSRLVAGPIFVIGADQTFHSTTFTLLGYRLVCVGAGLASTPAQAH